MGKFSLLIPLIKFLFKIVRILNLIRKIAITSLLNINYLYMFFYKIFYVNIFMRMVFKINRIIY